jgi:hypothetical protein
MNGAPEIVTVYRSTDMMNAQEDAEAVRNLFVRNGIEAQLLDSSTEGVPSGAFEIRVPGAQLSLAESLLNSFDTPETEGADPSHDLDMVTVRRTMGTTGEMQALAIKGILDSNGISSVVVGNSTMPNLSFFVRVSQTDLERADTAIAEAEAAGPDAAAEGELESERQNPAV